MSYYIAHRGNRKSAPQNTMKAFEKAFETGTDGIELDIHLTKDKRIVICHDYDIEPTSNGKGLISEMTYDELYRFDFGEGEHIPLLSSLLERNFDFKLINIEIKVPKDGNYDICRMTAEMLDKYDSVAEIIISSFGLPVLTEYKKYDSKRKTGILYSPTDGEYHTEKKYIKIAKENGIDALHPYFISVDRSYADSCRQNDIMLNVWGAASEHRIKKLIDYGVDSVITDNMDVLHLFR